MPLLPHQPALRPSCLRLRLRLLPVPRRLTLTTTTATRLSSPSIKFDQTKESNDPDGKLRPDDFHKNNNSSSSSSSGGGGKGSEGAQPQSGKSSGVLGEGGGSDDGGGHQAGGGKTVIGRVHKADKEAVDGAKQHSVRRPIPSEGNTSEGRGGDAL